VDPVIPTTTPGTTPVFQGAEADAQILRARLNDLFNLAPQGSVIQDPERRAHLTNAAEHVAELTFELGAIQRTIPGRAGRLFGTLASGLEKDPGTGKVGAKEATAGNFLPSPLGFLDPTSVGVPRNWYLPAGSTEFIPRVADRVGLGLPEQRAEDMLRREQLDAAAALSRTVTAEFAVRGEEVSTLQDLASGRGGFTRAGVIRATSGADDASLRIAAQGELDRVTGGLAGLLRAANLPPGAAAPVASVQPTTSDPVSAAGGPAGGPNPATQTPINDVGKRHEATAQGIARDLIAERADP
jgi:hypothetical protein